MNWKLSDLYSGVDDPAIKADLKIITRTIKTFAKYRNKVATLSESELLEAIILSESIGKSLAKIGLYADLNLSTQVDNATAIRFQKQISSQITELQNQLVFFGVELSRLPDTAWTKILASKVLSPYRAMLKQTAKDAKHTLSEELEQLLADKQLTSREALEQLFSLTTDTLTLETPKGEIALSAILDGFHNADPMVRETSAKQLYDALESLKKTTPAILNSLVQDKMVTDRWRKYEYPEESRYQNEEVLSETVQAMIKAVEASYEQVIRYYLLKAKVLGLAKLHYWDRYAPLPKSEAKIEIEQAKTMVSQSFHRFSPQVGMIADRVMAKHVDWLPSTSKRGGAFCAFGDPPGDPFVLLNYMGSPRDVMTLAHELGHAVHDCLAQEQNVYCQTHPSLALAEIASTFGESLLYQELMASDSLTKADRLNLLMGRIEDQFATVFRQASMFQFEREVHRQYREKGELSKEQLDDLWQEKMSAPFKGGLIYTDWHKNGWMYVGHLFHWPFYVFTYAFAQLCSLALWRQYQEKGSQFIPDYLAILSAGGSLSPAENLARFGLDINKAEFWKTGLAEIEKSIEDLEKLV